MFSLIWTGGSLVNPDILRRVFHSDQTPRSASIVAITAIPRSTVCSIAPPSQRTKRNGRRRTRRAQRLVAEDAPCVPIWNRTNVIVAQSSLDGLHLNAIGDFQALKDVHRRP